MCSHTLHLRDGEFLLIEKTLINYLGFEFNPSVNIPCHAKESEEASSVFAAAVEREGIHSFKAPRKFFMQMLTSVKFSWQSFSSEIAPWESASTCSLMRCTNARLHTFSISAPVTQ